MSGEKGLAHVSAGVGDVLETLHSKLVAVAKEDPAYRDELWERGWVWVTAALVAGGPYPARVERLPEPQRALVGFQLALSHYRDAVLKMGATPPAKLTALTEAKAECQRARKELNAALERLVASQSAAMMTAVGTYRWEPETFEQRARDGVLALTPLGAP